MNKQQIILRAFWDALGVAAYVIMLTLIVNSTENFTPAPGIEWLVGAMMLLLFIASACITGSLVLLKPVLLYVEGHKKDSIHLFVYTVGFLVLLALLAALFVMGR